MKTTLEKTLTMDGMNKPVRDYECCNGHKWTATPILSASTFNLSGERSQSCPTCGKLHIFASKVYDSEPTPPKSKYDTQAENFLAKHGLKFRATLSDSKQCPWQNEYKPHWRVTISRDKNHFCPDGRGRLAFDFWGQDAKPYSVLACLISDVHCPDTFEDFCSEYGYEEDSRKDFQVFQRASKFSARLNHFFTESEIENLSEIQ